MYQLTEWLVRDRVADMLRDAERARLGTAVRRARRRHRRPVPTIAARAVYRWRAAAGASR